MNLAATFIPQELSVSVTAPSLDAGFMSQIARDVVDREPYEGDYTVTPGAETVVLQTKHLRMTDNIVVNPVPSNYGKITWDGSVITVS